MDEKIVVDLDREDLNEVERQAKEHGHTPSEEVRQIVREHVGRERLRRDPVAWSRRDT